MKRFIPLLCGLFLVALSGCNRQHTQEIVAPSESDAAAKRYIELLRQDQFDQIQKEAGTKLKSELDHNNFEKIRAIIPQEEPLSVKVTSLYYHFPPGERYDGINYEYHFPGKWLLVYAAVWKQDGTSTLFGLSVRVIPNSIAELNTFRISGKSAVYYVALALVFFVPLFILYALVLCIGTKDKRKWLWVPFILCGVGRFSLSWSMGVWTYHPLALQLFGAGYWDLDFNFLAGYHGKTPVLLAPLNLYVSLPVGAIIFLIRRRRPSAVRLERGGEKRQTGDKESGRYDY